MKNVWEILNKNFVNKGLRIFPVVENGKTPLIKQWQKDCSSNFMQILYWSEHAKNCNWGMPATENNLFIIDLDVHDQNKNGVENFDKLLVEIGLDKVETLKQTTPSGGVHLIFQSNDLLKGVSNNSNVFKDYPGIDLRSDGYVVVEPSQINGVPYKFDTILPPMPMPIVLQQYILDNAGTKEENKKTPYEKPKEVYKGDRDNQLFKYINQLYYKTRLDEDEILVLAEYFNEHVLEEPFSKKDVKYKVKKAFEKPRNDIIIIVLPDEE